MIINKEEAKINKIRLELKKFINEFKYKRQFYLDHSEGTTELHLIYGLFEILGWQKTDFIPQYKSHREGKRGRVDYCLRLGEKNILYIEVKKVGISLEKEADKQVVSYASSQGITFAVSTNFESLNVFCVEQKDKNRRKLLYFNNPDDYILKINDLLLLSKESFEQHKLYNHAVNLNLLKQRISINDSLLEDLSKIRQLISNDEGLKDYDSDQKDEIVQRIIDRLVFIRKAEDTGINPEDKKIKELLEFPEEKCYHELKKIFKVYNDKFNSGLFKPNQDNDCDKININGKIVKKLIKSLYESDDGNFIYDFERIDADILGQVYEQYLGKILHEKKSGKTKLISVDKKKQGIYYTPTYVVDYIVKNTVGKILKDKKIDPKQIKILDPACGSGSFLIKAFDYMQENLSKDKDAVQQKLDFQTKDAPTYSIKTDILKNNIFGVDLDKKAVEITKLNLLLKAAEPDRKLPEEVDLHIRHGNSLIDDDTIEPKNYFKWIGDFEEGSFDVVIGNPPYINAKGGNFSETEKDHYNKKYFVAEYQLDSYILFIEKSVKLLNKGGYLGFIIPNAWMSNLLVPKIRKYLLENTKILTLVEMKSQTFKDASVDTVILILQKISCKKNKITIARFQEEVYNIIQNIEQDSVLLNEKYIFNISSNKYDVKLLQKIEESSLKTDDILDISTGIKEYQIGKGHPKQTQKDKDLLRFNSNKKENNTFLPELRGKNIGRYIIKWSNEYISYGVWLAEPRKPKYFEGERILLRQIPAINTLVCAYCHEPYIIDQTLYIGKLKNTDFNAKYVLGILNSKLVGWYFKSKNQEFDNLFPKIKINQFKQIPIKNISKKEQETISYLVGKLININNKINDFGDKKTIDRLKLEQERDELDNEINDLVYKLYGITEEEKKIIEDSLSK